MRLMHLSDLHLGKRVNGFSMLEDQKYILDEILQIARAEKIDAAVIAGDVYDKSIPPAEAVVLFDQFLSALSQAGFTVLIISGNHDSSERLSFGAQLMDRRGIYIAPVYNGTLAPVRLEDEYGALNFYLLPFIKPVHVRASFPQADIQSYTDAVHTALENAGIDPAARNVLVTHQFVTGSQRCESEEVSVGGTDNVDATAFAGFDYVALGHIHGPQNIAGGALRYCGTPLKYSFSEAGHKKSVTIVDLFEKGHMEVRTVALTPLRDMRKIRGSYFDVTLRSNYENTATQDYLHITLTDEDDIPDAMARLRTIYPNLMKIEYDNMRTRSSRSIDEISAEKAKSPFELFAEFYENRNNQPLQAQQHDFVQQLISEIWEVNP